MVPLVDKRLAGIRKLWIKYTCGTFSLRSPSEAGRERLMTSVAEVVELIVRAAYRFLSDEVSGGEELYGVVGLRREGKATKNAIC